MSLSAKEVDVILKNNNLRKDTYRLIENRDTIQQLAMDTGNILNRTTIIQLLHVLKEKYGVPARTSISIFKKFIINVLGIFEAVPIFFEKEGERIERYVATYTSVSPYEIALSLLSRSFLSHYSALYVHDLTLNNPKDIYINKEQSKKPRNTKNAQLTQGKVNYAFSKPMRKTKSIYHFNYKNNFYRVHVLNTKNTNNTGIIKQKPIGFSKSISVTNIERTLLDSTTRPQYSGGTQEVASAYQNAREAADILILKQYLERFNYIYPYQKSILFYLKSTKYPQKSVAIFNQMNEDSPNRDILFYLDYQIIRKSLDETIGVYYPAALRIDDDII
ncbi:hypothetical protein [Salinicoccus sp. YB14-2]|uniref:hypothetical protein n=1 Tax=Salinicoccus sp. YB14-2 TaxID=1572701 RepID=UPI0006922A68|nr:hypothetical protein [Salinicoccus sp. YB14-2]